MDHALLGFISVTLSDKLSCFLIATFFGRLSKATYRSIIAGTRNTNDDFNSNALFGIGCPDPPLSIIHLDFLCTCTFLAYSDKFLIILTLRL
jgi:hypothetical protein